jgi:hypothetical protein
LFVRADLLDLIGEEDGKFRTIELLAIVAVLIPVLFINFLNELALD